MPRTRGRLMQFTLEHEAYDILRLMCPVWVTRSALINRLIRHEDARRQEARWVRSTLYATETEKE